MADYTHELSIALLAVRQAAELCRSVQRKIGSDSISKSDKSPVTIADFASQAVILEAIGKAFPADCLVAEEASEVLQAEPEHLGQVLELVRRFHPQATGDELCAWIDRGQGAGATSRYWTLDPIDGTKGFLRKEQYAIALALYDEGRLVLGVLGCPNLPADPAQPLINPTETSTDMPTGHAAGGLFYAVRGAGAFVASLDGRSLPRPIQVSTATEVANYRMCESAEAAHSRHDASASIATSLGVSGQPVRMDSQAKYACVASGRAEVYLRLPTKPGYVECIWDHAAGVMVIEEAGGTVTDIHGQPLDFSQGRHLTANQGVVATNGPHHDRILAAVAAQRQQDVAGQQ
ncbi:MAG: 3'(2'),5'-bisphosphate nucleotidase [Planctomyces sp.]|nr:3'(2'),5'-bisphosphate nucleotidase [Planctomyces sp.]